MKICPKCNKSNPDNSKKCFYCKEDISNILPFEPEPEEEIPLVEEPEELEEEEEDFEDKIYEDEEPEPKKIVEKPKKEKKVKVKKDPLTPCEYVSKLFPAFTIVILALTVLGVTSVVTNFVMEKLVMKGVMYGLLVLILGIFLCLIVLWMNAIIFLKAPKKEEILSPEEAEALENENNSPENTENKDF